MFGLRKKNASPDDAYLITIRALGDALIQCGAIGKDFDPIVFSRRAVDLFEKDRFLITQAQADQIKRMRSLILNNVNHSKINPILEFLREISADMVTATELGNKDMMRECARGQMFAAAYLLKFFERHQMHFSLSPKIREGLDRSYDANIEDFLKDIEARKSGGHA